MQKQNGVIRQANSGLGCSLAFSLIWIVIVLFGTFLFMDSRGFDDNPFVWFWTVVMLCPGVLFFVWSLYSYYGRARFGNPSLTLFVDRLSPGQSFDVQLDHTFRSSVTVESFSVQLVFRESATYQQGTDTRTVTHEQVIESYELPALVYHGGQSINQTYQMTIPAHGMHTLNVSRNKLQWFIRVEAKLQRLRDYKNEYELIVSP